ncbi:MAG TPA: dihydrofolate reductase family protein [Acidimicrobiia bacterium]
MFNSIYPETGAVDDLLGLVLGSERSIVGRPWVMLNMVASIDGATSVNGRSRGLADDDDRTMFKALRAVPDIILVGAETARADDYGPIRLDEERIQRRRAVGKPDLPRLAVLSGHLNLDPGAKLFSDPDLRPIVLTGRDADSDRLKSLEPIAEVVVFEDLSIESVLGHFGSGVILCEGGPGINAQLAEVGAIDELNLTVAPLIVGGQSKRVAQGATAHSPQEMELDQILAGDRSLFLRYRST